VARPAPAVARQAPAAPRHAPQIAAPSRPSPRIAAPAARQAPAIERAAPSSRATSRVERRQQAVQQRHEQRQQNVQPKIAAPATTAPASAAANTVQTQRLQQLQSKSRLSRSDRRELQQLQRTEKQNAQKTEPQQRNAATTAQQDRLQQLQSKSRLSRSERRELQRLQRTEKQNAQTTDPQQRNAATTAQQDRLQQLQSKSRLSRSERRELRQLQTQERQNARQQQNQPAAAATLQNQQPRALRTRAVSAQQATQGRFASNLQANAASSNGRFAGRRAARLAARTAWQLGLLAPYVPWRGPVYYPYAYNDVFYYTFWPEAYDPGYWAYAYDDFFDGVFFPDGAPYIEYTAEGPYSGPDGRVTTGSAPSRATAPGRITQATRDFCTDQAKGVTAWPLQQISEAVQPNEDQKRLLDNLQKASADAAARFREACPEAVPMTPPGRLQAMIQRLQATDEAVKTVKPAVEEFYGALSDEQKARFNEIGPQLGQPRQQRPAAKDAQASQANCSGEKAGISNLAINRVEDVVRPSETQGAALDRLDAAMKKAVGILQDACPNTTPQTPVGRLDVMQRRLEAMIDAGNTVHPALDEFYTSLNDEQKAKFNRLGRDTAQSGG
jgi:hypothetical protein